MAILKTFSDGSIIEQDRGSFDDWCIYVTRPHVDRHAPFDEQNFSLLQVYAEGYSVKQVYDDIVSFYNDTAQKIDPNILNSITEMSTKYGKDSIDVDILYSVLYAAMVAEENKANTRLGKKIKMLGIHQVLFDNYDSRTAVNYSKGRGWRDILAECESRGF